MSLLDDMAPEARAQLITGLDQTWKTLEPMADTFAMIALGELTPSPLIVRTLASVVAGEILSRREGRKTDGLDHPPQNG